MLVTIEDNGDKAEKAFEIGVICWIVFGGIWLIIQITALIRSGAAVYHRHKEKHKKPL
jgi:hypothetical protein